MIGCKHITKIAAMAMAAAVLVCFLAMAAPEKLVEALGSAVVEMRYQTELFDTEEIMKIDIRMEESAWEEMLANASAEEYYNCDVEINGQTLYHVGIRPKGNTSLSAIVSDPDTDRFSLKLEFDHYVEGQTCLGLDKLILNNNYADATNMKEAIIYDMFQYLGVDASLYNYAEISVNGEYWGVYLALEAVEDSFLLRNYGTESGALYKPESMDGGGSFDAGDFKAPDRERDEAADWTQGGGFPMPDGAMPGMPGFGEQPAADGTMPGIPGFGEQPAADGAMPGMPGFGEQPATDGAVPGMPGSVEQPAVDEAVPGMPGAVEQPVAGGAMPGMPGAVEQPAVDETVPESGDWLVPDEAGQGMPGGMEQPGGEESSGSDREGQGSFGISGKSGFTPPDMGGQRGGRGFSMGGSGADLNYTDDELDSYSTIWEGEVTDTDKADHRRVITALKNISQGTELESYLDIDNVLRYMAAHVFSVNMDSLSGNMAHNYYLYESNGKLNILPWDYNLSFGGMGMGSVSGASEMINDAIDNPFQGTQFFDALLEDDTYRARYHEYLRQLAEEYVYGGKFQETYSRIRQQIDTLVETDPTAFFTYEEYDAGAEMLYQTVLLRAESIRGQLDGTIPSTDAGQRADSSALVDASTIDVSAMGVFQMGGKIFHFNGVDVRFSEQSDQNSQTDQSGKTESGGSGEDGTAEDGAAEDGTGSPQLMQPDGKGGAFEKAEEPGMNGRGQGVPAMAERAMGACLLLMAIALAAAKHYRRVSKKSLTI